MAFGAMLNEEGGKGSSLGEIMNACGAESVSPELWSVKSVV